MLESAPDSHCILDSTSTTLRAGPNSLESRHRIRWRQGLGTLDFSNLQEKRESHRPVRCRKDPGSGR